jgi:hypothetical protein
VRKDLRVIGPAPQLAAMISSTMVKDNRRDTGTPR